MDSSTRSPFLSLSLAEARAAVEACGGSPAHAARLRRRLLLGGMPEDEGHSGYSIPKGLLARLLMHLVGPTLDAQVSFNSRQVQLDNALLEYLDRRFAHTHQHYDDVLGVHGRHLQEIDERHLILQEELVAHVHDLVKRIDLVLSRAEREGSSLRYDLRDLRARIARFEQRLGDA